jgi:endonuclease/exonuclease/phosphatase family metal-dependent hydrolase
MKLISWNIQWCRGCDGRVDPARISKIARDMADFDVLCLQEVARNYPDLAGSSGENQYETLAGLFSDYTVVKGVATDVPAPGGDWREFGNAIVTRLPILQVFRRLLPWPADPSVPSMQRSAVEVVLDAPSGPLRVTTTHLEYYSLKQRAAQVEALRELQIEAAGHAAAPAPAKENGPFRTVPRPASGILTADFNFPPDDALHAHLQSALASGVPVYRDAWQLRHPRKSHAPTLGVHDKKQWPGPPIACDFIFVTEDLAHRVEDVAVNGETDASDHQPVLLVLRDY